MRFCFAKWACDRVTEDADFGKKNFDLSGYVNKKNCHIWGTDNSHAYIENESLVGANFGPEG